MKYISELNRLGWQPFFLQQLSLEDYEYYQPARVIGHDRSRYVIFDGNFSTSLPILTSFPRMTVGDWILIDSDYQYVRLLDRKSLFSRRAAGTKLDRQLIAANVDTLFIVSSLNHDFNLSRIERYLVLAREAEVEPVVVLTKADLTTSIEDYLCRLRELDPHLRVVSVNALSEESCLTLKSDCCKGSTVALLGSSGVGKSTIINTLLQSDKQSTESIREDDSKGRHTTTSRSVHFIPDGGVIIDTPGMRELKITDCSNGIESTFTDIETLSRGCRFSDCTHTSELGCEILKAIDKGILDVRRLANYKKLKQEEKRNSMALHELRAKEKNFKKMVNAVTRKSRR